MASKFETFLLTGDMVVVLYPYQQRGLKMAKNASDLVLANFDDCSGAVVDLSLGDGLMEDISYLYKGHRITFFCGDTCQPNEPCTLTWKGKSKTFKNAEEALFSVRKKFSKHGV